MGPRLLYSHGFASGPSSSKGRAFAEHFTKRGVTLDRLNLRVPSFERLRLSAGIEVVRAAIGGPADRAIAIGSSLGGLTSARAAERDPRIIALVLLAPAFQIAQRWRAQLGEATWEAWRTTGTREVTDYTTNQPVQLDHGFIVDVAEVDPADTFPDVRVPTLIFHGVNDDAVPVDHSRRFAAGKPHVTLVELDDGHDLAASVPRILAESTAWLEARNLLA